MSSNTSSLPTATSSSTAIAAAASGKKPVSKAILIASIVAGVEGLLLIILLTWWYIRRRRDKVRFSMLPTGEEVGRMRGKGVFVEEDVAETSCVAVEKGQKNAGKDYDSEEERDNIGDMPNIRGSTSYRTLSVSSCKSCHPS